MSVGSYDYQGLMISFLNQNHSRAKTAQGRMSYNGTSLYSYSSQLAEIDIDKKILYVFYSTASYSVTSHKQASRLYNAASAFTIFTIEDRDPLSIENLQDYWNQIEPLVAKYKRARTRKFAHKHEIHRIVQTAKHYAELHDFDPTVPDNILRMLFVNCLL